MANKSFKHILKSNSDGELLDSGVPTVLSPPTSQPTESTLKRRLSLPFRLKRRKNDDNEAFKLFRTSSIRKGWNNLIKNVKSVTNNKTGCSEFDGRRPSDVERRFFPSDKVPGVTGLRNHGNTCFINAVLQCLTHTDCLAEYFVMNQYKTDMNRRNQRACKKYGTKGK